jgi:hypothetical protein
MTETSLPLADATDRFLAGAAVVAEAVADRRVAQAWAEPSVLEDQLVGGLAGHLARGAVWAVADYLDGGPPAGPVRFESAAAYFAGIMESVRPEDHQAIRRRGAEVGSVGPAALAATLDRRRAELAERLAALDGEPTVAVIGGVVTRLADYLLTRLVEQVVHLDDLARSIGADPWPLPPELPELVARIGTEVAFRRHGAPAVVLALFRPDRAEGVLPVF